MALPWLIGALVVGIAAKVLSSDSDDDKESRADRDREERRREELERERHENERRKKQASAQENFAARGEKMGTDIAQSLRGWIEVQFEKTPAFSVRLTKNGHQAPDSSAAENAKRIRATMPNGYPKHVAVQEHLEIFTKYYAVNVSDGVNLINAKTAIKEIERDLVAIESLKIKITAAKNTLKKTS